MPLLPVLLALGWDATAFKVWKQGQEFYKQSPIHGGKKNNTAFSFPVDGRWNCFSCGKKGRGAIDLCMAVRSLGFQEAVATLRALDIVSLPAQAPTMRPTSTEIASEAATSENPPFAGQYHKFFVDSAWLRKRGFEPRTPEHFGVGEYNNPAMTSAYKGKLLLPMRRWKDGELVGYLVRTPEPAEREPKYIWPKGFQKSLELLHLRLVPAKSVRTTSCRSECSTSFNRRSV